MKRLSNKEILNELSLLNDWVLNDNQITKVYKLNSFMEVMSLSNLVSDKSEQIDHHPKMIIDFNQIEFLITTHSEGGITNLDFILASFIEETYNELFS
ncbi:MAG: 4a-hydroxytetrahydrobiopterin dehydratase [Bacteroidota bacterium]|nr:4a-hydroxytetrahydrobiopterin dehydratase [Bacteroidota bacterium]